MFEGLLGDGCWFCDGGWWGVGEDALMLFDLAFVAADDILEWLHLHSLDDVIEVAIDIDLELLELGLAGFERG